jgi:hypothetical protein
MADGALRAERTYASLRRVGIPELASDIWQPLIAEHRALRLLPSYECKGSQQRQLMDLVLHAVRAGRPVSTMYLSRFPEPGRDCAAEAEERARPAPVSGELLVLLDWPQAQSEPPPPPTTLPPDCRLFRGGLVCTLQWEALPPPLAEAFAQDGDR